MDIDRLSRKVETAWGMITLPRVANRPRSFRMDLPRRIINPKHITIGDNVSIGPNSVIAAVTEFVHSSGIQRFTPRIVLGDRVAATMSLSIYAGTEIIIDSDVITGPNVGIYDMFHGYETAEHPYGDQPFGTIAPVRIKRGCWIGQNVVICPGVTIGEFCIIGANSVVTKSIPDRCIAVGTPAKAIKSWNAEEKRWVPVPQAG
jgi:acetyltransferase-like isoleucine patch superfamily enzyme